VSNSFDCSPTAPLAREDASEDVIDTAASSTTEAEPAPPATAEEPVELTHAEMDIGYLALYEDFLPVSGKPDARPSVAAISRSTSGLVLLSVRAVEPELVPVSTDRAEADLAAAPPSGWVQELEPEAELNEEELEVDTAVESVYPAPAVLQADAAPGLGNIVDLPKIGPATWGDPVAQQPCGSEWMYQKPHVTFLAEPPERDGPELTEDILEETAGKLEKVIRDFGVKGEVIHVHPGPVVTLYEFEPAPGIKSSRVIALAEDIARSMSAVSARVAVIPGRNAIGIELPNEVRETVYLRELLSSEEFETSKHKLPLCLGKTIGGESVIADLARMPHLLVAGTTGSGKSVAINTMILSLLYRFTPRSAGSSWWIRRCWNSASTTASRTSSRPWSPTPRRRSSPYAGPCARWRSATRRWPS
jgi:S-DNA-T family DNA segregation ATPase FtsK/SpoIIIE